MDVEGMTPLARAAFQGYAAVAKQLLAGGANVEAADTAGWTPLHHAVFNGNSDVAKLLLEKGAKINAVDAEGTTLLHRAVVGGQNRNSDVAKHLVQHLVQHLLDKDSVDLTFSVDPQTPLGHTPLHIAAFTGQLGIVEYLVEKGANVNLHDNAGNFTDIGGNKPVTGVSKETIDFFISVGVIRDGARNTPLHLAALGGKREVAEYLVKNGARPSIDVDDSGLASLIRYLDEKDEKDKEVSESERNERADSERAAQRAVIDYLTDHFGKKDGH